MDTSLPHGTRESAYNKLLSKEFRDIVALLEQLREMEQKYKDVLLSSDFVQSRDTIRQRLHALNSNQEDIP